AATPPWAFQLLEVSTGALARRSTSVSAAAVSAAVRPATPPPTTIAPNGLRSPENTSSTGFILTVDNLVESLPHAFRSRSQNTEPRPDRGRGRPAGARPPAPGAAVGTGPRPLCRRLVAPGRRARTRGDARGVDPPPPGGEGGRPRGGPPRAARDPKRS